MNKLKTLSLRIPTEDYDLLEFEAEKLQIRPGTLARILLHSSLAKVQRVSQPSESWLRLQQLVKVSNELSESLYSSKPEI